MAGLIDKYNKKFNPASQKPVVQREEVINNGGRGGTKYNQNIINPIAVPDPGQTHDNYSWMYLMTPYYNQMVNEFNQQTYENHLLKQHFEVHLQLLKEQEELNKEFETLKKSENYLNLMIGSQHEENYVLNQKVESMEENVSNQSPQRIKEVNEKLGNLN